MSKEQVTKLLKSGNFTIAYHDSDYCCLYEGQYEYDDLPEEGEIASFDGTTDGYISEAVEVLVKALGGKVVTI
jgi:hypothetical protein